MKAMVLAAGAGTRLRPLTLSVPKPMVPIANRPVLEYTLVNLKRHGITDVMLNLHNHPQMIRDYFGAGERWGMRIQYSLEPDLLGTAGAVKKVSSFLKSDTFLVMSGDGFTDIDLTRLLKFHVRKRSVATMALKGVDTKFEYGVTLLNSKNEITRFIEKPSWSDVFSNHVNAGIYVFEPEVLESLPSGRPYDFGREFWPNYLKKRKRIYGYVMDEYWCDVGNLAEYRRAQHDVLEGNVEIPFSGKQVRPGIWVDEGTVLARSVRLEAPCLIGRNCRIDKHSIIGAHTVIGNGARIGSHVVLRNCILWNDVRVDHHVTLENCVIAHHARVNENISVYEGAVIAVNR